MTNLASISSTPKISVIIPVYNHAHWIGSAIQSILAQTYQDYEIIIVDDGSTDNLVDTLKPFNEIKIIRHAQNLGRAAARNTGVLAASGKYIAFLDADDQWMPTKLAQQIVFLEANKTVSVCLTGYEMLMPDGQYKKMPFLNEQEWARYFLKYIGLADGSVPMIRRSCFDRVGLQDTELTWYQNWDWLLRATNQDYKVGYIRERLSLKRKSQKRAPAGIRETATLYFVKKHAGLFQRHGLYGRSAISLRWYNLSIDYFYEKNWRKGTYYLFKALFTYPFQRPGLYFRLLDALLGTRFEAYIHKNVFYKRIKQISN